MKKYHAIMTTILIFMNIASLSANESNCNLNFGGVDGRMSDHPEVLNILMESLSKKGYQVFPNRVIRADINFSLNTNFAINRGDEGYDKPPVAGCDSGIWLNSIGISLRNHSNSFSDYSQIATSTNKMCYFEEDMEVGQEVLSKFESDLALLPNCQQMTEFHDYTQNNIPCEIVLDANNKKQFKQLCIIENANFIFRKKNKVLKQAKAQAQAYCEVNGFQQVKIIELKNINGRTASLSDGYMNLPSAGRESSEGTFECIAN